jgi:hypothetical protein
VHFRALFLDLLAREPGPDRRAIEQPLTRPRRAS